jgi:hypothetical protein
LDLVGSVGANGVAAESLAGLNIPNDEGVVVLATEGSEVLLVLREGERLDQDLVELEAMDHLKSVEVPNDDVRLNITRLVALFVGCDSVLYIITLSN